MNRSILVEANIKVPNNGSEHRHPSKAMAILFTTEALISLIANLVVVFLFCCRKRLFRKLHNRYILSLSISDILTAVFILVSPNYVLGEQFYKTAMHNNLSQELYCRMLWNNFLPFALGNTSLYTSVALSLERWLAVRWSIFYKTRFKTHHMNTMIVASWSAGFISEIPVVVFIEGVYDQSAASCRWNLSKNTIASILLSTGIFLIQTVLPALVLTLAYIDVFRGIRESVRFAASARAENMSAVERLKKVTKVASITSLVLAICWLPCGVAFFLSLLHDNPFTNTRFPFVVFFSLLAFGNSCINPCIYVFLNPELRDALKGIFRSYC